MHHIKTTEFMRGRKIKIQYLLFAIIVGFIPMNAAAQKKLADRKWSEVVHSMPEAWYGTDEAKMVAENVLLYQRNAGGWPKNTAMHLPLPDKEKEELIKSKNSADDVTIDNGGTVMEMIFLAKMYKASGQEKYRESFLKGVQYLLDAQYKNGGWPQFFPLRKGYYTHITYNDNAMINVLELFNDILTEGRYAFVNDLDLRNRIGKAVENGVQCILNTQYVQNGKLTVWCAQHDENTMLPAKARSYELPSLSGSESAGIVLYLMKMENPPESVIKAVHSAVAWFEEVKLTGIAVREFTGSDGKKDRQVVRENNAPFLWARFYTLEDNRPFFCDRDGIKKYTLAEIGHERRNGYSWYTAAPQKVLDTYRVWSDKFPQAEKVR